MNTIKKIGRIALLKVFKSENKTKGQYNFSRKVRYLDDEFIFNQTIITHESGENSNSTSFWKEKVKVMVWGIEVGLLEIDIKDEEELYYSISNSLKGSPTFREGIAPSHVIIIKTREWYSFRERYGTEEETVSIHPLSQLQQMKIINPVVLYEYIFKEIKINN